MNNYTHYTIYTVVDIGDGNNGILSNGKFTSTMNFQRLVEHIMKYAYPTMVSLSTENVDMTKEYNKHYYALPFDSDDIDITVFKFVLDKDVELDFNGIPLVIPNIINDKRITKFSSTGDDKNIHVMKHTFT